MSAPLFLCLTCLYLLGFALIHTFLASNLVKTYLHDRLGRYFAFYRLCYNLLQILLLLGFVLLFLPFDRPLYHWPASLLPLARFLQFAGVGLILWVLFIAFDFRDFSGLNFRQELNPATRPFRERGPFRLCRHPMYFGTFISFLFVPNMSQLTAIFTGFVLIYSLLGSVPEEHKLVARFGESYRRYQQHTKRLIPFIL